MRWLARIRPVNMVIIVLTQLLVYVAYVLPISIGDPLQNYPPFIYYLLITLITCIVVAGGYIINDIFDIEIDKINKPHSVLQQPKKWMFVYKSLFIMGLILVVYVSFRLNELLFTPIYILTWLVLLHYSKRWKCKPLIGNVVVALLSSAAVLIVLAPGFSIYITYETEHFKDLFLPVIYYTAMAFMLSLMREIVKDMEDVEGDRTLHCRTLVVSAGLTKTKVLVHFFHLVTILFSLGFAYVLWEAGRIYWVGFIGLLSIVLFWQMLRINKGGAPKDFKSIQKMYKVLMVIGILFFLIEPYMYT